jgi:hypothetical protein
VDVEMSGADEEFISGQRNDTEEGGSVGKPNSSRAPHLHLYGKMNFNLYARLSCWEFGP